ncbi:PIG-L deacetylase family protein [Spirochaeta thermophila]|uniref:Putative deacetylase n=1 Tax=Winmispira thermophila (strain ATCC 49972 / DSM 6192 / RI 19.B1) TaxID=665571 RepID=E0RNV9_WINT6|nr:PIG-L family deacetylase [Spirochaeta thermophila]ADN01232.1 putative deacetylase [Spirochaeta thermophila DSM 6192]
MQVKIRDERTGKVVVHERLAEAFPRWQPQERWLFISPHDDDVLIGGGILLQRALEEGVDVHVLVTTDGAQGYCDLSLRDSIVEVRREETALAYRAIGVHQVHLLDFPDGSLHLFKGRRRAQDGDPGMIEGYTGLQNALTFFYRKLLPSRVFLMSLNDYHPDHKVVHEEAIISLFHAHNPIWAELGPPTGGFPRVYELAAYGDFVALPSIRVEGTKELKERKLRALDLFVSQKEIIASLVSILRERPAVEYVREYGFKLYDPAVYEAFFS